MNQTIELDKIGTLDVETIAKVFGKSKVNLIDKIEFEMEVQIPGSFFYFIAVSGRFDLKRSIDVRICISVG